MAYEVVPLAFKPHRLTDLSDRLLVSHYENNYGGAVRRLNAIEARLSELDWAGAPGFTLNGLGRERLIAANSMLLHELYFHGLGGSGRSEGALAQALERDFGSVDRWRSEFTAMGKALSGGSGWVLLTWSDRLGRLHNQWAADHAHALAEGVPIFALDMYEHAYALDFGPKAAAYVDAVMRNLHWGRISARYSRIAARAIPPAPVHGIAGITVGELRSKLAQHIDLVLLDVCLAEDLPRRPDMLPGARFVLAEDFDHWAPELPRDRPVIVSCMYGFQVSEDAATELRRRGVDAYKLAGGLSAWRAMDGRTAPLNAGVYEGGLP